MMTVHQPFADEKTGSARSRHAIVIGSGFGGLAAAVRLGARGYRVTVLEQLDGIGGRASQFRQDGFTFDAGPTIVTAPFVFEELWALCGRRMEDDVTLKALDPFYTVQFADGTVFRTSGDDAAMRAEVARFNPDDVAGYERYLKESEACFRAGFLSMIDKPYSTIGSMIAALPDLIMRRADRSVHALVSRYVKDERLRMALSFHPLFIGGNPLRASGVLSLISYLEREYGVHYAMGGTHALVTGIAGLIMQQGGTILTGAKAEEILIKDGAACGVRIAGGETLRADIVVSNADTGWTYKNLLPAQYRKRWTDRRVSKAKHSMSLFVWYFGTNRRYDDVDHHTVIMGPRYAELLRDIFDRKVLAEDFSLYLHRPSKTDPSVAPEEHEAFYVLAPVPNLEADIDWTVEAEPFRRRIAAALEERLLPGLSDSVVTSRIMTPLDFRDRLLSEKGAAFGMEPVLTQLAWFRPHNASEEVRNLFIVGAGTHPGAGLPGVVSSAKILDKVVPHATEFA